MHHSRSLSIHCRLAILITAILSFPGIGLSQSDTDAPKLYFQNRQIDPLEDSLRQRILEPEYPAQDVDSTPETSVTPGLMRLFSFSRTAVPEEHFNYYVVQFTGPVQSTWKATLTELGAEIYDYIPQYAFIIRLADSNLPGIEELDFVRWIGEYAPELKLSQGVYDISPQNLEKGADAIRVRVLAFPGEDADTISGKITEAGGTVLSSSSSEWNILFDVEISIKNVDQLKEIEGVKWIEKAPEHRTRNNIAIGIIQARSEQEKAWYLSSEDLFGEGQTIAVCDSGIDTGDPQTLHEDFSDGHGGSRVINTVFPGGSLQDYSGHGTHVAGIIAGNGMLSGASPSTNEFPDTCYAGVAPRAQLYFQSVGADTGLSNLPGIPTDITDLFQPAYDAGARIHTNSWGTSGAGSYDSEALIVDQFMWTHKDFMILYAVGNAGYDKDMNGVIDPYCIDSPATAKNCLSVGAGESYRMESGEGFADKSWGAFRSYAEPIKSDLLSDAPYGMAAFSSRGPTLDGRYKPEIIAPGTNILSTRSSYQLGNGWGTFDDDYFWSGGTSMATPFVAGAAAVMREYLMKEEGYASPSAALVKTSLIHGTTPLVPGQYGTGTAQEVFSTPDEVQGWGRLNLKASINSDTRYSIEYFDITDPAPTDTNYNRTFTFEVENGEKPFRATLGWTDYPGSVAVSGGLVNDLDLRVQRPDGTWAYPDNAVSASSLVTAQYITTVNDFYTEPAIGLRVTPPSYPCTLESVVLAYSNRNSLLQDVSVVVYRYNGSVGDEIYRKTFAYIPSGEYALPIGLTVTEEEIFVAVEKTGSGCGIYYQNGNEAGRGLVRTGEMWETAEVMPALVANFRTQSTATRFDRLNNTVSITIDSPTPGTYTAEITAHNIPVGPQPYAFVMSGMKGEMPVGEEIEVNPNQADAPASTLLSQSQVKQTAEDVNAMYGTGFEAVYGKQQSFSVVAPADSVISMRFPVRGLPKVAAKQLSLTKLFPNGTHNPFTYASSEEYSDGKWWLTDIAGNHIRPGQRVRPATTYYVVFALQDGGDYDENSDPGRIDDPLILGTTSLPKHNGGCTIGATDEYGPTILVLLAGISMILRRFLPGTEIQPTDTGLQGV